MATSDDRRPRGHRRGLISLACHGDVRILGFGCPVPSRLSKSTFLKGADFVAVCVFMFASTNLVVELGIVLWLQTGRNGWVTS